MSSDNPWWEDTETAFLWDSSMNTHGIMDERTGHVAVEPNTDDAQVLTVKLSYLKELVDWADRLEDSHQEVHIVCESGKPLVIDPMSDTDLSYVLCPRVGSDKDPRDKKESDAE